MIRLYVKDALFENQHLTLDAAQSHYLKNVMRLKLHANLFIFNGQDGEWNAQVIEISKKSVTVVLLSQNRPQVQTKELCLFFSPLKPKRQEFLVEKATELGVSCLWPLRFERTSVPKVNLEKMHSQAQEAAEQCGRLTVPVIKALTPLSELLKNWPLNEMLLFGDETLTSSSLLSLTKNPQISYHFLVGPEGGLTLQEQTLLKAHPQVCGVTLSPHILRAETAALVGVSYLRLADTILLSNNA